MTAQFMAESMVKNWGQLFKEKGERWTQYLDSQHQHLQCGHSCGFQWGWLDNLPAWPLFQYIGRYPGRCFHFPGQIWRCCRQQKLQDRMHRHNNTYCISLNYCGHVMEKKNGSCTYLRLSNSAACTRLGHLLLPRNHHKQFPTHHSDRTPHDLHFHSFLQQA